MQGRQHRTTRQNKWRKWDGPLVDIRRRRRRRRCRRLPPMLTDAGRKRLARLFVTLRNRFAFLVFSFRKPLKNRRVAIVVYCTKRNVPIFCNGSVSIGRNLFSPLINVYYHFLFLPNCPLTYLQYIALL